MTAGGLDIGNAPYSAFGACSSYRRVSTDANALGIHTGAVSVADGRFLLQVVGHRDVYLSATMVQFYFYGNFTLSPTHRDMLLRYRRAVLMKDSAILEQSAHEPAKRISGGMTACPGFPASVRREQFCIPDKGHVI
jgi:hypothetical protein